MIKKIIQKQKSLNQESAKPINLESLVNSGKIRISKSKLIKVSDKSKNR